MKWCMARRPSIVGFMTEQSSLPQRLAGFVSSTPGVDSVLLFTRDSMVHAYSRGISQEAAEQWSALLGNMLSMSDQWARVTDRGACEHILLTDQAGRINVLALTPGCGAGLFLAPDAEVKKCAFDAHLFFEELKPVLPQEVPTTVGAAHQLQGVS